MASHKGPKKRQLKKPETVRERAAKPPSKSQKDRIKSAKSKLQNPISKVFSIGKREYYLPLPDNKLGGFLNKRRSLMPRYFIESWRELKQVSWPDRKKTAQLSLAVFIFAIFFGVIIALVDFGLDKAFKALILE